MASEVMMKCWLCPETFEKSKELKDHAISKHSVCKVVCPWCFKEEKTFGRISELTKHTKRRHPDLVLELVEGGEFFTEKNGFWLALRPQDYAKIITPGDWTTNITIRTRAAVIGWVDSCKAPSRTREQWEAGWRQAFGMEVALSRKRKYSPSRPSIDYPTLAIEQISLTSKSKVAYLRMEEAKAEVWFKVEFVHWVVEDRKAMDNLLRRMTCLKGGNEPLKEFNTELKTEEAKYTVGQVATTLGIGERHIRRLYRGTIKFGNDKSEKLEDENKDIEEEPEYEIMDTIEEEPSIIGEIRTTEEEKKQNLETEEHQSNNIDIDTEEPVKDNEVVETGHEEHMRICQEEEVNSTQDRAEKLLLRGGMPLFPPGRREWGSQKVLISSFPTEMYWPPKDWEQLDAENRLTSWRFAAMALERESGATSCVCEGQLLDKYAMLALPGTPVGKTLRKGGTAARTANYNILVNVCKGKVEEREAKEWLEMFEAAPNSSTPHALTSKLENIPLRLKTDRTDKKKNGTD